MYKPIILWEVNRERWEEQGKPLPPIIINNPCCNTRRSCRVKKEFVISVDRQVLEEIPAVRCYRYEREDLQPYYMFYPTPDVFIVFHYITNRGNIWLALVYPRFEDRNERWRYISMAKQALGIEEVMRWW